jgi:hypothetical protein
METKFQENNNEIEFDKEFEEKLIKLKEYDSKLESFQMYFAYGTSGFRYDEKLLDKVS